MKKEQLDDLKKRFVEKIEFCYNRKYFSLIENPKHLSDNFLFDNITEIGNISYYDIDKFDVSYSNENKELQKIVLESLLCIVEHLKQTRNDKPDNSKIR
jgi:hypothetical protein